MVFDMKRYMLTCLHRAWYARNASYMMVSVNLILTPEGTKTTKHVRGEEKGLRKGGYGGLWEAREHTGKDKRVISDSRAGEVNKV